MRHFKLTSLYIGTIIAILFNPLMHSYAKTLENKLTAKEIQKDLLKATQIFSKGEFLLMEFDFESAAKLRNENDSLIDLESYQKLTALNFIKTKHLHLISQKYLALHMLINKTTDSQLKKEAQVSLNLFHKMLSSNNLLYKLAFEDLRNEVNEEFKNKILTSQHEESYFIAPSIPPIKSSAYKNHAELVLELRQSRKMLQAFGESSPFLEDELDQEVRFIVKSLYSRTNEEASFLGKVFFPSTGQNGNIVGLVFPKKTWALTYDDGPNPLHTKNILNFLGELKVKANFFWLAQNVIAHQDLVKEVQSQGHLLANHTWSHAQLTKLDQGGLFKEINQSTTILEKIYGHKIEFFRCPYGAGNNVERIRKRIADLGMLHVFWNVDTLDWQDKDPESVFKRAQKQMLQYNRGVVLFHDIHPQSVIASKKLVEWSKVQGVRWVKLNDIVKELNGE